MKVLKVVAALMALLIYLFSCDVAKKKNPMQGFSYQRFKTSLLRNSRPTAADTTNIFDTQVFTPATDSFDSFLLRMDSLWNNRLTQLQNAGQQDSTGIKENKEETDIIHSNIQSLRDYLNGKDTLSKSGCREKECPLLAEVVKSKQVLYLYIGGELKDSFAVSTGIPGRETPDMSVRPSGPVFMKYTSKKFPGGNYQGLGNMPYAVFVKGGYAIHGTTQGNFAKLGTKASHGCIRLHPDHAKIFFELANLVGLQNTWVIVR